MTRLSTAVRRDTARLFIALAAAPALATAVRVLVPPARPATHLGLAYPPPSGNLADAADILVANARVSALVIGATLLVASVPVTATPLALLIGAVAGLNVAMLCIGIAADGTPAALALLPHAPVELLAFSVFGAGFLHARRCRRATSPHVFAATTAGGLLLLVAAAALEVTPA